MERPQEGFGTVQYHVVGHECGTRAHWQRARYAAGEPETRHHRNWQHYTAGAEAPHLSCQYDSKLNNVINVPTMMTWLRGLEPLSYPESKKSSLTTPVGGEEGET